MTVDNPICHRSATHRLKGIYTVGFQQSSCPIKVKANLSHAGLLSSQTGNSTSWHINSDLAWLVIHKRSRRTPKFFVRTTCRHGLEVLMQFTVVPCLVSTSQIMLFILHACLSAFTVPLFGESDPAFSRTSLIAIQKLMQVWLWRELIQLDKCLFKSALGFDWAVPKDCHLCFSATQKTCNFWNRAPNSPCVHPIHMCSFVRSFGLNRSHFSFVTWAETVFFSCPGVQHFECETTWKLPQTSKTFGWGAHVQLHKAPGSGGTEENKLLFSLLINFGLTLQFLSSSFANAKHIHPPSNSLNNLQGDGGRGMRNS